VPWISENISNPRIVDCRRIPEHPSGTLFELEDVPMPASHLRYPSDEQLALPEQAVFDLIRASQLRCVPIQMWRRTKIGRLDS
jgi:hypothetical protein